MEIPKDGKVLIEFYSPRSVSCRSLNSVLDAILKDYPHIRLVKVNVFKNRELAKKYGVIALPVLVMLENGREVGRLKGLKSKEEIIAFLEGYK